jgi:hypothetical protein
MKPSLTLNQSQVVPLELGVRISTAKYDTWRRSLIFVAVLLMYTDVFSGVLRYAFKTIGASFLFYVPFGIAIVILFLNFTVRLFLKNITGKELIVPIFFVVYAVYSLLVGRTAVQVGFSIYTWTPFFIGVLLIGHEGEREVFRHFGVLWVCACFGVLVSSVIDVPWVGDAYDVAGYTVEAAQDWDAEGVSRLVGFARSHVTAANEIGFFFACLMVTNLRPSSKIILWVLSIAAVYATTSKANIVVILVIPALLFTFNFLRSHAKRMRSFAFSYVMAVIGALMAADIVLPLILGTDSEWVSALDIGGSIQFMTTGSLFARAIYMWPDAFDQIAKDLLPIEWVFGRGLGGIGAAQHLVDSESFNAADNFFVFNYVTFGLPGLLFFVAMLKGFRALYDADEEIFRILFSGAATVSILGTTGSTSESVVPALILGMLVGKFTTNRFEKINRIRAALLEQRAESGALAA